MPSTATSTASLNRLRVNLPHPVRLSLFFDVSGASHRLVVRWTFGSFKPPIYAFGPLRLEDQLSGWGHLSGHDLWPHMRFGGESIHKAALVSSQIDALPRGQVCRHEVWPRPEKHVGESYSGALTYCYICSIEMLAVQRPTRSERYNPYSRFSFLFSECCIPAIVFPELRLLYFRLLYFRFFHYRFLRFQILHFRFLYFPLLYFRFLYFLLLYFQFLYFGSCIPVPVFQFPYSRSYISVPVFRFMFIGFLYSYHV